jgi:hypothetical protein
MRLTKFALLTLQLLLAVVGFLFAINAIELAIQLVTDLNMSRLEHHDKVIGIVASPVLMSLCLVGATWLRRKRRSSTIQALK